MEFKNCHFATIPVKLIQARMINGLYLGEGSLMKNKVFTVSKYLFTSYLLILKENIAYNEKQGHILIKWIDIYITSRRQSYTQCLKEKSWERPITHVEIQPKMAHLNSIMRKPNLNHIFNEITGLYSSEMPMAWKTKEGWGTFPNYMRIKRHDNGTQYIILDNLLSQNKNMNEGYYWNN